MGGCQPVTSLSCAVCPDSDRGAALPAALPLVVGVSLASGGSGGGEGRRGGAGLGFGVGRGRGGMSGAYIRHNRPGTVLRQRTSRLDECSHDDRQNSGNPCMHTWA
jgi:hypothetical protein